MSECFAQILLIIPFTNAKVERLFTKMNRLKSIERNWLGRDNLDLPLHIGEEGPPSEEFNPKLVIYMWFLDKVCCLTARLHQPKQTRRRGCQ